MGGGLIQLISYGPQDVYLTGSPEITFFKMIHKRHTNFAIESIKEHYNEFPSFGKTFVIKLSKSGDLLNNIYLDFVIPSISSNVFHPYLGHNIIKDIKLYIGGQLIATEYGEWIHMWRELTLKNVKQSGYNKLVGATPTNREQRITIPLPFWFSKYPSLSLPIVCLQNHEIEFHVTLNTQNFCTSSSVNEIIFKEVNIYADYIFLDTFERRIISQQSHEFLIEQIQATEDISFPTSGTTKQVKINFNHPIKELIWRVLDSDGTQSIVPTRYTIGNADDLTNPISKGNIQINRQDHFAVRKNGYFNYVHPYYYHSASPAPGINIFSFCFNPEEHQPSGACNFSQTHEVKLSLTSAAINSNAKLKVYGTNYNIVKFMGGYGGVAFSN